MKIIQPEAHILPFSGDVLKHVERCGRIAYKSEDAITEDSHVKFIQHLIQRGHESVLEHGNYVFELPTKQYDAMVVLYTGLNFAVEKEKGRSGRLRLSYHTGKNIVSGNIRAWRDFIRVMQNAELKIPAWVNNFFYNNPAFEDLGLDYESCRHGYEWLDRDDLTPEEQLIHWTETVLFTCSRAISHELVRHRALSPTQESQRYCNYSKGKFGCEITFIEPLWVTDGLAGDVWREHCDRSDLDYMFLIQQGLQPQQAREVLPNSTKTEVVMTGTIGEWIHFFNLRCAEDAHPEMRRLAKPLRTEFNVHYTV